VRNEGRKNNRIIWNRKWRSHNKKTKLRIPCNGIRKLKESIIQKLHFAQGIIMSLNWVEL